MPPQDSRKQRQNLTEQTSKSLQVFSPNLWHSYKDKYIPENVYFFKHI